MNLQTKLVGVESAIIDTTAASLARGTGNILIGIGAVTGGVDLGAVMNAKRGKLEKPTDTHILRSVGITAAGIGLRAVSTKLENINPGRWIVDKTIKANEFVGLKGVQLLNKIYGKR